MTTGNGDEYLQQVVYRDSERHLLGRSGIGPVATSLHGDDLKEWNKLLLPRVGGSRYPYPSLCYLTINEHAALLYRERDRLSSVARPQDFAHVLIGSRRTLRVDRALGMLDWQWPEGETMRNGQYSVQVSRIHARQFGNAADAGLKRLRDGTAAPEDLKRSLIERVKLGASEAFVILTDEDQTLAARLLDTLIGALGADVIEDGFSTYEEQYHDKMDLPRLVFSTGRLAVPNSYQFTRKVIRLRSGDDAHLLLTARPAPPSPAHTGGDVGTVDTGEPTGGSSESTDGTRSEESPVPTNPPVPTGSPVPTAAPAADDVVGISADGSGSGTSGGPAAIGNIVPQLLRGDLSPDLALYVTRLQRTFADSYYLHLGSAVHERLLAVAESRDAHTSQPRQDDSKPQQRTPQSPVHAAGEPVTGTVRPRQEPPTHEPLPADAFFTPRDWLMIVAAVVCFVLVGLGAGLFL